MVHVHNKIKEPRFKFPIKVNSSIISISKYYKNLDMFGLQKACESCGETVLVLADKDETAAFPGHRIIILKNIKSK